MSKPNDPLKRTAATAGKPFVAGDLSRPQLTEAQKQVDPATFKPRNVRNVKKDEEEVDPDFSAVRDLRPGIYSARKLNPPSGDDCSHLLVREDGSLGWCYPDGSQSEDHHGTVSSFTIDDLCGED